MRLFTNLLTPSGGGRACVRGALIAASLLSSAIAGSPTALARACPVEGWTPGEPIPGVDGEVFAMTLWDPDGAGPQAPKIVIGGSFTVAGNVTANKIAALDTATKTWSAFSTGMAGTVNVAVRALAVLPTGELVAGGEFTTAGGVACRRVAKWNGTTWSNLPNPVGALNGVNGTVHAMLVHPDGNLIVGGDMNSGNPDFFEGPLRWNPSQGWRAMASGLAPTRALTLLPTGDVVAGGNFLFGGPTPYNGVARWDGTAWQTMGSGMLGGNPEGTVYALTTTPTGDVVAAGRFTSAGGVPVQNVARWNGTAWSAMGAGLPNVGSAVTIRAGGQISAALLPFNFGGGPVARVYEWNGVSWSQSFQLDDTINALLPLPDGELVLGGKFLGTASRRSLRVARTNASLGYLTNPAGSVDGQTRQLAALPDGRVAMTGYIASIAGQPGSRIGIWNGTTWTSTGATLAGNTWNAIATLSTGQLVAWGPNAVTGVTGFYTWNGASWDLLTPFVSIVDRIIPTSGGGFYALGVFVNWDTAVCKNIMHWSPVNGPTPLGAGFTGINTDLEDALVTANGDLIVVGRFSSVDGVPVNNIARWNGSTWSAIGTGLDTWVNTVIELPNGDLIAGGQFSGAINRLARWDGTSWSQFAGGANNEVTNIVRTPSGDIIATGRFTQVGGATTVSRIARWNGATWSSLGAGLADTVSSNPFGTDLVYVPQTNEVFVAGQFTNVHTQVSAYAGRYALGGIAAAISQPPASGGVCLGDPAALGITSTGTSPITYQWRKGGVPINAGLNPSAATPSLLIPSAGFADAGSYDCLVTNDCGNATSLSATLSVLPDFNADNAVNTPDLVFFLGAFGTTVPPFSGADITGDGTVNTADLVMFLASFGATCP